MRSRRRSATTCMRTTPSPAMTREAQPREPAMMERPTMPFQKCDELDRLGTIDHLIHRFSRTLEIRVDRIVHVDSDVRPEATVEAYVQWLGLWTSSLAALRPISRETAGRVCEVSCAYDIAYERRRLSSEDASKVARAWLAVWSPACSFFSNVAGDPVHAGQAVLQLAATPAVFFDDISLGVIAIDGDRAGLFFYHSSS